MKKFFIRNKILRKKNSYTYSIGATGFDPLKLSIAWILDDTMHTKGTVSFLVRGLDFNQS